MLRTNKIGELVLSRDNARPPLESPDDIMNQFKIKWSSNEKRKEDGEFVMANLRTALDMMMSKCTV